MSATETVDAAASSAGKPATKRFRKVFRGPMLTRDQAIRQGGIARVAWERLGQDAAKEFLNNHHEGLAGRPLDIATASAEGYSSTERAIDSLATSASPAHAG